MDKIIRLAYWLSIPLFLVVLLYIYAMLPLEFRPFEGKGSLGVVSKSQFFYALFALMLLPNAFLYLYTHMRQRVVGARDVLLMWLQGLILSLNISMTFVAFSLGIYHSKDLNIDYYEYLNYPGPLMLVIWIFYGIYLRFFGSSN